MPIMKRCGSCCVGTFQEWNTAFVEKTLTQATFLKSCGGLNGQDTVRRNQHHHCLKAFVCGAGVDVVVDPVCGSITGLMRPGEPRDSILCTSQRSQSI
jgi:hypothetical protein